MADLSNPRSMPLAERLKILDKVAENYNKKAGKKVAGRIGKDAELLERLSIRFIETPSQNVNDALGGGFPRRRMTIIAGLPDSGKTSLALETIAINQKRDPNFVAGWLESEESLEKDYICDTFGIDPNRFFYIEHEREGAGERAIDEVEGAIATGALDMMCINSLKALVPSEEFKKDMGSVQVGAQARMNAKMTRKFTSLIAESNCAFIIITHLTTQIGSMSRDPLIVSGGNAILYAAGITMDLRRRAILDTDPIGREQGVKIAVKILKNHCAPDRNPYVRTEYFAIFGQGIEQYLEVLENAIAQDILKRAGSWIRDVDPATNEPLEVNGVKLNWQGKEQFRNYCIDNEDYFTELKSRVKGVSQQMDVSEIEEIEEDVRKIDKSANDDDVIKEATAKNKKKK
jgi:recombination protein RecA